MKIIKFIFIFLIIVFILIIIGGIIFVKTFDANRYKPEIIRAAKTALARDVDFTELDLAASLADGIRLTMRNPSLGEDPQFGTDTFFQAEKVYVGLDPLAFLKRGEVAVSGLEIDRPAITLIRGKDGRLNVETLAQTNNTSQPKKEAAIPLLLVNNFRIQDGTVRFIDYAAHKPVTIDVGDIDLGVRGFSPIKQFSYSLNAAVLSDVQNIKVNGKAQFDIARGAGTVRDLTMTVDLSQLAMERVQEILAALNILPVPKTLDGVVTVTVKELVVDQTGITSITGNVTVKNGIVPVPELAVPLTVRDVTIQFDQSDIVVDNLLLNLGEGRISANGRVSDFKKRQEYTIDVSAKDLNVGELIDQRKEYVQVEGLVAGSVNMQGRGFDPEVIPITAKGSGTVHMTEGKIKNINVFKNVLDQLAVIPGLAEALRARLPKVFNEKLTKKDTILTGVEIDGSLKKGKVTVSSIDIRSDDFYFVGNGVVGFDERYTLKGSFYIPAELSAHMMHAVRELGVLANEKGEIRFPLTVTGQGEKALFYPDVATLGTEILLRKGIEILQKKFSKEKTQESPGSQSPVRSQPIGDETMPSAQTPPPAEESEKSPEEQLLEDVMGAFFKK